MRYRNVLIVKLSAIGDVIHALPVAEAMKSCYPGIRLTWVVEKAAYDLVSRSEAVDEVLLFEKNKFKTVGGLLSQAPSFIRLLRSRRFDLALDLQGLFKSAAIAWLSGASRRLVYENAREGSSLLCQRVQGSSVHVVDKYLDVVRFLGCQVDTPAFGLRPTAEDVRRSELIAAHAGLKADTPYVVLIPGANWPNKRWPAAHYAELADVLFDAGVVPVITGAAGDSALAEEIIAAAKIPPVDLTGKTEFGPLMHILRQSRCAVGGDTGPLHLAAAMGTPCVAFLGPTDVPRNGPYGRDHTALTTLEPCHGCWQRFCPKGKDCLGGVTPAAAAAAVLRTISKGSRQ